jgi:transcriptional regulator with XRE-family HTH domain
VGPKAQQTHIISRSPDSNERTDDIVWALQQASFGDVGESNHTPLSNLTVGERLELRRRRRGLSRKVVANLVGRSEEWLRLVESGRRKLDSVEALVRLVEILRIDDPSELIDFPASRVRRSTVSDVAAALRQASLDYPVIRADMAKKGSDSDLTDIAARIRQCRINWWRSPDRYSRMTRDLPSLLRASATAHHHLQSHESARVSVDAYHLARELFTVCGDNTMAAIVADRAMGMSNQTGSLLDKAISASHVAETLCHLGFANECLRYSLGAINHLTHEASQTVGFAALRGAFCIVAARAAAMLHDMPETARLMAAAFDLAHEIGLDSDASGVLFGPTEVGIATVELALCRHDPDEAIRQATCLDIPAKYVVGQIAKFHINLASAYIARADDVAATFALTKAAQACPEDIRYDGMAQRCLLYLIRRSNSLIRHEVDRLISLVVNPGVLSLS